MLKLKKYNNNAVNWFELTGNIEISSTDIHLAGIKKDFLHKCEQEFYSAVEKIINAEYKNCRG